jgi:hypothetical protein
MALSNIDTSIEYSILTPEEVATGAEKKSPGSSVPIKREEG